MKNDFLQITYIDQIGVRYSDILAVSELSISHEWLERIVSVTVLNTPPITYIGKDAKAYLLKRTKITFGLMT